jgi:arylformamidase
MRIRISYPLTSKSPFYPGTPHIEYQPIKSIEHGDSANTTSMVVPSHAGSHIDVPKHFCHQGDSVKKIIQSSLGIFPVYCIDVHDHQEKFIRISDIEPAIHHCKEAQGIFLRTGMFHLRNTHHGKYSHEHPGIHPEIPDFLKKNCPSLKIFGTDTVSVSNPQFREEGRECHRKFLCGNSPVLLAEDLDLSDPRLLSGPFQLEIYPWIIDDLDGVPICAFVEFLPSTGHSSTKPGNSS